MRLENKTILISGGATGIGLALAEALSTPDKNNQVIICGRRKERLSIANEKLPGISTVRCDVSNESDRRSLFDFIQSNFGKLDILVNNAGIQRQIDFKKGPSDLQGKGDEIDINFKAHAYMTAYFTPMLMRSQESAIVNVTSGLAFVPLAVYPLYSATKAAMHSFSISLRHQLRQTSIKVFEVVPPIVHDTELKGKPLEKMEGSVSASEVANAVIQGMENNQYEIGIGPTSKWIVAPRADLDKAFLSINRF